MANKIIHGSIASYNPKSGKYFVKYQDMGGNFAKGYPAQLLSPIPVSDGGGTKAVPAIPVDTPCLIHKVGNYYYILGFLTPQGAVSHDDPLPTRSIEAGESYNKHHTGSLYGVNKKGAFSSWVASFVNFVLDPVAEQFTAMFKNMVIHWYAGMVQYKFDSKKNTSTLQLFLNKEFDSSMADGTKLPRDMIAVSAGYTGEDEHMIDAVIRQDIQPTYEADYEATAKIGKQTDGTFLALESKKGITGAQVTHSIKANVDGSFEALIKNKIDANAVKLTIASDTPNVELDVADGKAIVTIDNLGNVTIKTADGANIKLGGQGKEQQLVTKTWVEQVFANHIHPNGNQGAPTAPPNPNNTIDIGTDSASGHFTYTTKAE